jgi:hypothetical protein
MKNEIAFEMEEYVCISILSSNFPSFVKTRLQMFRMDNRTIGRN